jgi:integrase
VTKPRAKGTGTIFKPKGSRFYWIAYMSGGKRHFEGTGSERKGDAQDLLTARLGDVSKGIAVTPKMGRTTFANGLKAVVNDLRMNGRDSVLCPRCKVACCGVEGHGNHIQRQIDKHILYRPATADAPERGYFKPDRRMSTITTSDLTAYVAHRLSQGAAAASVNHELATIRRAFRLAVRGGELAHMPHVPMLTLHNTRQGFFEREQFEAVRGALPEALRGIVTFAYITGWRVQSEVLPLQWAQVDRRAQIVRLEVGTTKNDKGRTLPYGLLPELIAVLDAQWQEHERLQAAGIICPFVFSREGKQIREFRGAWKKACTTAECPAKLLHDFRRTAVRNLTRAGVPEQQAMAVTGHKTRSVFDRYDIVNEADLRSALGKLAAPTAPAPRKGQLKRFGRQAR